jgi:large subunit ribosomal protein L15
MPRPMSTSSPLSTSLSYLYPFNTTAAMPPTSTPFICLRCLRSSRTPNATRGLATVTHRQRRTTQSSQSSEDLPRWLKTPARMKMPIRLRPEPHQPPWIVNTRQEPVDEMYDRFLGTSSTDGNGQSIRGRDMLPEEIKVLHSQHPSLIMVLTVTSG